MPVLRLEDFLGNNNAPPPVSPEENDEGFLNDLPEVSQEEMAIHKEQKNNERVLREKILAISESEEDATAIGSLVNNMKESEEYKDTEDSILLDMAKDEYYNRNDSVGMSIAKDVGGAIFSTEIPQAIAGGVEEAINQTAEFVGDVGNWIEDTLNIGRLVFPEGQLIPEYWSREEVKEGFANGKLSVQDSITGGVANFDIISDEYDTVTGAIASGITQFAAGMIGAGKFTMLKSGAKGFKGIRNTMINAGIADAVVFDPDEQNLAAMLKENGWAEGAVADYLATDMTEEEDNRFKNRLKNMAEGAILGGPLELMFRSIKKVKLGRVGRAEINENGKVSDATVGKIADQEIAIANGLDKQKGKKPKGPKVSDKKNLIGGKRQIDLENIKYNSEAEAKRADTAIKTKATKNANQKIKLVKEFEKDLQVPKVKKDIKNDKGEIENFEFVTDKNGKIVYESAKGKIVKKKKNKEGKMVEVVDTEAYRRLGQIILRNPERLSQHTEAVTAMKAEQVKAGTLKEGEDLPVDQLGLTADNTVNPLLNMNSLDRMVGVAADFNKIAMEKGSKFKWDTKKRSIDNLFNMAITQEMDANQLLDILNKNGMSYNQFILGTVGSFSQFGKGLQKAAQIGKYGKGLKSLVDEKKHKDMMDRQNAMAKYWLRIENIRRGAMVSSIATASRNLTSALIRMPLEGMGNVMDQAIFDLQKGGVGKATANLFSGENWSNSFKGLSYLTARDLKGLDDWFFTYGKDMEKWQDKMYGQMNEIRRITGKKEGDSIGTGERVLQGMEKVVDVVNVPNRMQEFLIRRSVFFGEMQRLMKREWDVDFLDSLDKGKIKAIINNDTSLRKGSDSKTFEQLMESATTKALDVTYAKQANTPMFREATTWITKYGGTLIIPFPRFMFNALELMGNYAGGASMPFTRKIGDVIRGDKDAFKSALTDMDRQRISRNLVGVSAAMAAYMYRMTAESEDYKVIDADMIADNAGIDTTPQFPMRQYLWVGEAMKRLGEGTFGDWFDLRDVAETFGGTNVRAGTGQVIIEDIASYVGDANFTDDLVASERMGKSLGNLVGNYLSSWAIPIGQIADFQRAVGLRQTAMKEYAGEGDEMPIGGMETFQQQATIPLERRGIGNLLSPSSEEEIPDKQYLFQEGETKDRVAPALRALFGLNVVEKNSEVGEWLTGLGIKEWKVQSKSGIPSVRNIENKIMRDMLPQLKEETDIVSDMFEREWEKAGGEGDDKASFLRNEQVDYVRERLSDFRTQAKEEGTFLQDAPLLLQEFAAFKKLDSRSRKRALMWFKTDEDRMPDYTNAEDLMLLNEYADLKP
jgi:hypothetical protein